MATDYPWQGSVEITVTESPDAPWTLTLRVPHWAAGHSVTVGGQGAEAVWEDGWLRLTRTWRPGDVLRLELDMPPRVTAADPRVDAVRGCVDLERGPLVYCVEAADQLAGQRLDDLVVDPEAPVTAKERPDLLGGVVTLTASGRQRPRAERPGWWPYGALPPEDAAHGEAVELTAVPFFAWGSREPGAMRVWLPTR